MANIDEVLGEYDVVVEPEDARDSATTDSPSCIEETEQKLDEAPPADSASIDDKTPVKKNAMIDGHQVQNPPVEILCPRMNCSEKIVRIYRFYRRKKKGRRLEILLAAGASVF